MLPSCRFTTCGFALLALTLAGCSDSVVTRGGTGSTGVGGAAATGGAGGGSTTTSSSTGSGPPPLSTTCDVKTIATGLDRPSKIIGGPNAGYVVVTTPSSDQVMRIPIDGASAPTVLTDSHSQPIGTTGIVAADATNIAWIASDGSVDVMPASGGATTVLIPPGGPMLQHITLAGGALYASAPDGSIERIDLSGGAPTTIVPAAPKTNLGAIALDNANIYWAALANDDPLWRTKVWKMALAGGAPVELAHFQGSSVAISLFGDALFAAQAGSGTDGGPDGVATGNGSVFRAPIDLGAAPQTLVFGLGESRAVAADASGVYWGGGMILYGGMAPAAYPASIDRIAANGVWETIVPKSVTDSMVECGGGVCWPNLLEGTVLRAVCDPNPPSHAGTVTEPTACTAFCNAMGGCSRAACHDTCKALLVAPCAQEGGALVSCLAKNLDELTCETNGCDDESSALAACRAAPPPAKPLEGGGGAWNATSSYCQAAGWGPAGEQSAICTGDGSTTSCTCYLNLTPVGTCSGPFAGSSDPPGGCFQKPCCNALFGNAAM